MKFETLAQKRRTIYEFDSRTIPASIIKQLLDTARWAPSCTNIQPWHFIIITDRTIINEAMRTVNYGDFHTNPPVLIAVVLRADACSGPDHQCYRDRATGVHDTFMSCGIAASYITLAATDRGIDSCLLTPEQQSIKKILRVKSADAVPLLVGLGYRSKRAFLKPRERKPLRALVSKNAFEAGKL